MAQSLPPSESLRKENVGHFQPTLLRMTKYPRYSRHLSFQHERASSNGKSRIIIHATIRSPKNNRRVKENKSTNSNVDLHSISTILTARHRQDRTNNSDVTSNSIKQSQSVTRPSDVNIDSRRFRSLSQSNRNSWNNNNGTRHPQVPYNYSANYNNDHSYGTILESDKFSSSSKRGLFGTSNKATKNKDWLSNTKDFHQNSIATNKKRKYPSGLSCPCIIATLLTALLLSTAIAAALIGTLIKAKTTTTIQITTSTATTQLTTSAVTTSTAITTISSTTVTSTTNTTTLTTTISTTVSTTVTVTTTTITASLTTLTTATVTTTVSTTFTSTTETTTTSILCTTPTSTALYYNPGPSSYTLETYNYVASFTGTAVLEFGFISQGSNNYWYLDDVSIVDQNSSNSEMLSNGGFENGTLVEWQVLCTSSCTATSGTLSSSSCHAGLFCFHDGCKSGLDFLRQTLITTIGHVYTLSFWLKSDTQPQQVLFVRIF